MEKFFELEEKERVNYINELILKHKDLGGSANTISDKWHTFEELYFHRMILFYTIQKANLDIAWKSKKHHDDSMFEDSFIVGLNTPLGQYTYHYGIEYWDLFDKIIEVDRAPEYDGHLPDDVVRLLSL